MFVNQWLKFQEKYYENIKKCLRLGKVFAKHRVFTLVAKLSRKNTIKT